MRRRLERLAHHVGFTSVSSGSSRATKRANFGILRRSLAIIRSAIAGPMPGRPAERLGVLILDRRGDLAHRANHRPQRLPHADAIDRAEQLEELLLDLAQKADQPRRQPPLHRIAFEIIDRVQADFAADLRSASGGARTRE